MKITEDAVNNLRRFEIGDDEWFDRKSVGEKTCDILGWKIANQFSDAELSVLVKVDWDKVNEKVQERLINHIVTKALESWGRPKKEEG